MAKPQWSNARSAAVSVTSAAASICFILSAWAGEVIFPSPLHLSRRFEDPVSGRSHIVEEYYYANRAVSIGGELVAIADYAANELTVIDRRSGTYSVAPFSAIAGPDARAKSTVAWEVDRDVSAAVAGKEVVRAQSGRTRVTLILDPQRALSRAGMDVVLGAAFPGAPGPVQQVLVESRRGAPRIAGDASGVQDVLPLPIEQTVSYDLEGEVVEVRSVIIRVGNELAPAELIALPPGARRVPPRSAQFGDLLRELDSLKHTP